MNQKLYNNSEQYITAQAGVTPVMVASRRGQRDVVKVLLSHGADVSMVGLKVIHYLQQCHSHYIYILCFIASECNEQADLHSCL